jgi:hypothetical protein
MVRKTIKMSITKVQVTDQIVISLNTLKCRYYFKFWNDDIRIPERLITSTSNKIINIFPEVHLMVKEF